MTSRWQMIGNIQREDGRHSCENVDVEGNHAPGCSGRHEVGHHGCFPAQKSETRKEYRTFLDSPINYVPSSHVCNTLRNGDPEAVQMMRLEKAMTMYPDWEIKAWLSSAPDEIKTRHTWKNMWKVVSE